MHIANSLNIVCNRLPLEEMLARTVAVLPRMAAAGYSGADFNFFNLITQLDWRDETRADAWLDTLAQAAADAGLTWVQAHGPTPNMLRNNDTDRLHHEMCAPGLRACQRLGVPWMVMHPSTARVAPDDRPQQRRLIEKNIEYFRSLAPLCEQYGVGIAVENNGVFHGADPQMIARYPGALAEELCEIVDAVNHPLVGACWDTGHAQRAQVDQPAALRMLGRRLKALHVNENDGQRDLHIFPFTFRDANLRWPDIMAALRDAGYTGDLTLEVGAAFDAVPDALFDDTLRYSVQICRTLREMFMTA
jgi:sugar phosphate isomerase/epimerase